MNKELIDFFTENPNAITFILSIDFEKPFPYKSSFENEMYHQIINNYDWGTDGYFLYFNYKNNLMYIRRYATTLKIEISKKDIESLVECGNFL